MDYLFMSSKLAKEVDNLKAPKLKYILMLKDGYSGYCTLSNCTAPTAIEAYRAILAFPHGAAKGRHTTWVSDGGSHFNCELLREHARMMGVHHHITCAYAPFSNGTIERLGRSVLNTFKAIMSEWAMKEEDWPSITALVQRCLNEAPLERLGGHSPARVHMNATPADPFEYLDRLRGAETDKAATSSLKDRFAKVQEDLANVHKEVDVSKAKEAARYKDIKRFLYDVRFEVGDFVLVARRPSSKNSKLGLVWQGPYQITKTLNPRVFEVQNFVNGETMKVHAQRMQFYADTSLDKTAELADHLGNHFGRYEVEALRGHRWNDESQSFDLEVAWLGFEEPTWSSMDDMFEDQPKLVKEYVHGLGDSVEEKHRLLVAIGEEPSSKPRKTKRRAPSATRPKRSRRS
jgi:hypothetical protein